MDNSPLRKLPPEICNKIWELALTSDQPVILDEPSFQTDAALTRTCRELRKDTRLMFFSVNDFVMKRFYRWCAHLARDNQDKPYNPSKRCGFPFTHEHDSRCHNSLNILYQLSPKVLEIMRSITIHYNHAHYNALRIQLRIKASGQTKIVVIQSVCDKVSTHLLEVLQTLHLYTPLLEFYHNTGFAKWEMEREMKAHVATSELYLKFMRWMEEKYPWMEMEGIITVDSETEAVE